MATGKLHWFDQIKSSGKCLSLSIPPFQLLGDWLVKPQSLCIVSSDLTEVEMEKPWVGKAQAESANSVIPDPQKYPIRPYAVPCAAPSASSSEVGCSTWPSSHRGVSFAKAMTWSCRDGNLPWLQHGAWSNQPKKNPNLEHNQRQTGL